MKLRTPVLALAVAAVTVALAAVPAAAAPTPKGNRQRASTEVARLMGDRRVPPGAGNLSGRPPAILRGHPVHFRSLVSRTSFVTTDLTLVQARKWINAHPLRGGLTRSGRGRTTGPHGVTSYDFDWTADATRAYIAPGLAVAVAWAKGHDGTVWRFDASAEWLDPRPIADRAHPRIRVDARSGCPHSIDGVNSVRKSGRMPTRRLVPATAPESATLCVYRSELTKNPLTLQKVVQAHAPAAGRLATTAHAISLAHLDGEPALPCPPPSQSTVVIDLRYAHRSDIDLWDTQDVCNGPQIRNGALVSGDALDHGPFDDLVTRLAAR